MPLRPSVLHLDVNEVCCIPATATASTIQGNGWAHAAHSTWEDPGGSCSFGLCGAYVLQLQASGVQWLQRGSLPLLWAAHRPPVPGRAQVLVSNVRSKGNSGMQDLLFTARAEGSVPLRGCCAMTTLQCSHLLALAAELLTPKHVPHPMSVVPLWNSLRLRLTHSFLSHGFRGQTRDISAVPHPRHGVELCQVSTTATLQFQLAP